MTRDEFVSKFKVGDTIRIASWHTDNKVDITAIGKLYFLAYNSSWEETNYDFRNEWAKVEEPKKPSEEIAAISKSYGYDGIHPLHIVEWLDQNWPKVQQLKENK